MLWFLGALFLVLGVCGPLGMATLNTVAFQLTPGAIRTARIDNVGQSQSCMVSEWRLPCPSSSAGLAPVDGYSAHLATTWVWTVAMYIGWPLSMSHCQVMRAFKT